ARAAFPDARKWCVLCGAGNNAGDGFVVARMAAEHGMEVTVLLLRDPGQLKGDAAAAARDWHGHSHAWADHEADIQADLVIDALLGTGLDRELRDDYREAVGWINAQACPVVALDIPSGLNADTGCIMGSAVEADLTVTFIGLKRGLFTGDGPDYSGRVVLQNLDVPASVHQTISDCGIRIDEEIIHRSLVPRRQNSHKGQYGHVLVVGGARGMPGAARLAGEAALRSGAGLVTVATHPEHTCLVTAARPELMVHSTGSGDELEAILPGVTTLAVGPGLGQGDWGRGLLELCLSQPLPVVVDADGLNLLSGMALRRSDWVLTPHPAEAARLESCATKDIQADRVGAAQQLAARYGATVVLKGCGTVVADPDGRYSICSLGNPGMATAGSGDVLTGVIAALIAQGLDVQTAARVGVAAHAAAGDHSTRQYGQRALIAGDIVAALPAVLTD
ncbi:MAG: NAD(P)H-hydrate dehydratase, partial [Xanthomonadales bacterium]|nr:NAD(P)H-hydrate dehydratase [Xanthomonadales bacterium]